MSCPSPESRLRLLHHPVSSLRLKPYFLGIFSRLQEKWRGFFRIFNATFVWPNERTKCRRPKTPFQLAKADTVRRLQLSPPKQWIKDPSCCSDHELRNPIRFIVAVISYKDYTVERSSTTEKLQTCGLRSNRYGTKTDAARNSVPIFR